MTKERYPKEVLDPMDDDGTMPESLEKLTEQVVGHKIVEVIHRRNTVVFGLDNGRRVKLVGESDCCAYTQPDNVIVNLDKIEHVITGVGTTEGYERWHIYADLGDVVEMQVGWSCGNPFYYAYGFNVIVEDEA